MKNKIRELRKRHELTQDELAELIGISRQAINAIEKEKFDLIDKFIEDNKNNYNSGTLHLINKLKK